MSWLAIRRLLSYTRHPMKTVILLIFSNIFMTFAWYGHLRYRSSAPRLAILFKK